MEDRRQQESEVGEKRDHTLPGIGMSVMCHLSSAPAGRRSHAHFTEEEMDLGSQVAVTRSQGG